MLILGIFHLGKDEQPRKTSDPNAPSDTRAGGRRKSRQGSGSRPVTDRGELAFRSVSREHERTLLLVLFVCLRACVTLFFCYFFAPQCTHAWISGSREINADVYDLQQGNSLRKTPWLHLAKANLPDDVLPAGSRMMV